MTALSPYTSFIQPG